MICGTALQTLVLLFIVYRTNWNREVNSLTFEPALWLLQFASHGSQSSSVNRKTEKKGLRTRLSKSVADGY